MVLSTIGFKLVVCAYMSMSEELKIDFSQLFKNSLGLRDMTPTRIKTIRKSYKMTQVNFSDLIMVNYETYRSWEEGRRFPSSPGYAILSIAEKHPQIFMQNRMELINKIKNYNI